MPKTGLPAKYGISGDETDGTVSGEQGEAGKARAPP